MKKRLKNRIDVFANIEREDFVKLEEIADKFSITKSELIRIVLKTFLEQYYNKPLFTLNVNLKEVK